MWPFVRAPKRRTRFQRGDIVVYGAYIVKILAVDAWGNGSENYKVRIWNRAFSRRFWAPGFQLAPIRRL